MPEVDQIAANLGLVDPRTGEQAVSTPDRPATPDYDWVTASEERAQRAESGLAQRDTGTDQWDTDANPYRKRAQELEQQLGQAPTIGQSLEARLAALQRNAATTYDSLVAQQVPPQLAELLVGTELGRLRAEEELNATRTAALPMVRRGAAEDIARQFTDKKMGVIVNVDEIASETSVEGMKARAKALADTRRDAKRNERAANQTTRVEGPAPSSGKTRAPDNMSPAMRIKYGLERGHL